MKDFGEDYKTFITTEHFWTHELNEQFDKE